MRLLIRKTPVLPRCTLAAFVDSTARPLNLPAVAILTRRIATYVRQVDARLVILCRAPMHRVQQCIVRPIQRVVVHHGIANVGLTNCRGTWTFALGINTSGSRMAWFAIPVLILRRTAVVGASQTASVILVFRVFVLY